MRLLLDTPDHHPRLAEVGLRMARRMEQRHEHLPPPPAILANVVLHDRVAAGEPMFGSKPVKNTLGGVTLLARLVEIVLQLPIDDRGNLLQL